MDYIPHYTIIALFYSPQGKELTMGICKSKKRLDGKVAIITGANSGKMNDNLFNLCSPCLTKIVTLTP